MRETEHFVNEGFGWECRRCRAASAAEASEHGVEEPAAKAGSLARFFREGEAEEGGPRLSTPARARWADESRKKLRCPVCGVEEEFKSRL
ncbi:MAG: hypothetical protein ABW250_23105 [Pyrinomonadaceae bacterium]